MEFNKNTKKHNKTVTFRLSNFNPYETNDQGNTPLHLAASRNNLNQMEALLKLVPNESAIIEKKNNYGSTALHYATWFGQLSSVQYLVEHGADLTTKDSYDQTLLHAAAWNGHLDLVKFFLENGLASSLEDKDQNENTPLLSAARNDHFKVVKWLLSVGADIKAKDKEGDTILVLAVKADGFDIIDYVAREKQIDLSLVKDNEGYTLLHLALLRNIEFDQHRDMRAFVQTLLDHKADINSKDNVGITPLHLAAASGDVKLTQYLIKQGANIEAKDNAGETPFDFAKSEAESGIHDFDVIQNYLTIMESFKKKGETFRLHEVHQNSHELEQHYLLKENKVVSDEVLFSDVNLLRANPNQTKAHRSKKKRHHASKSQAVTLNNPFDMSRFNESLPSLDNTSGFFGHDYSSGAEANPFNLSSIPERGLTDNLETNHSNVSEAFLLAGKLFNSQRKKHGTTPVGDNERLNQQVQVIDAIETFDPNNVTATKPFN